METDRNLLFGVLAFQDDYLDLAQLAAICRAWAADKSRSIPQLLVERQWLTESERDELERKVARKLKHFIGDARATLGAVADDAVRDVLVQVGDPDIHAAIPELNERRLGFHPDHLESHPDRSRSNPKLLGTDPNSHEPGPSDARYTRYDKLGKGTFGIVWLAHDKQLDREVALKELKTSKSHHPDLWKRFLREAQVTGKLQHPNIVSVYELDPRAGGEQPFYTMKPVRGRTLRKAIDAFHQDHKGRPSETLELNRLLQAFVQVCEALAYAHSRDVVHRDLKPENIVLGDFSEVIVLDWGEAKLIGTPEPPPDETAETVPESEAPLMPSSPGLRFTGDAADTPGTKLGTAKGSPGYMSPEQVRGDVHLMEPRTDIYGLGAILFDILIGHPPHQPTAEMKARKQRLTIEDWRSIILANPTPYVRQEDATIPVALEAICARAMAAELSSRYSSANEFAHELRNWLVDQPLESYRTAVAEFKRLVNEHPTVPEYREGLARRMTNLGLVSSGMSRHAEAEQAHLSAITNYEALIAEVNTPKYRADLAFCRTNLGHFLSSIGRKDDSEAAFRAAAADYQLLLQAAPNSLDYRSNLASVLISLGHPADSIERALSSPESHDLSDESDKDVMETLAHPADETKEPTVAISSDQRAKYVLEQLVGQGGSSKIWLARESDLNRSVVLKELRDGTRSNSGAQRRLVMEAQITAQLEHPNIIPVYGLGHRSDDGLPFYTMRYVSGRTFKEVIFEYHQRKQEGNADIIELRKLLRTFTSVCNALAYAHARGVIHRDVKPANILVGRFGEAYLLDWGLAKFLGSPGDEVEADSIALTSDADVAETMEGQVFGTPAYMAPEQAAGRNDLIGTRTDIYMLGTVLFEILTGSPPHGSKKSVAETLQSIIGEESPRARNAVSSVPLAADAICAKAMEKSPSDRYSTAADLADDIERWLNGEPMIAYRIPWWQRLTHRLW